MLSKGLGVGIEVRMAQIGAVQRVLSVSNIALQRLVTIEISANLRANG